MMQKLLFACLFVLFSAQANAITYANFALGGGYESVLIVSNKTEFPWAGTVWLNRGLGSTWAYQWAMNGQSLTGFSGMHFTLNPHQTYKMRFTGDATTRTAYCNIDSDSGYSDLSVTVSYFFEYRNGVGALVDSTGDGESAWGDEFTFPVEYGSSINTGLAWCPSYRLSTSKFSMYAYLYNSDGSLFDSKPVTFEGHKSQFINELFALPSSFVGSVIIRAQGYMYLMVVRIEFTDTGFEYTSTPADTYMP
jgi:hypothetical protein